MIKYLGILLCYESVMVCFVYIFNLPDTTKSGLTIGVSGILFTLGVAWFVEDGQL